VSFLLIASLFGVWQAFSLPSRTEQPIAVANYEHRGGFYYQVYLKPNSLYGGPLQPQEEETEQETSAVFFRNIIDKAQLAFSYKFDSSEPVASITNDVVVTIIAENLGMWQKEIPILKETHEGQEFRVNFPLQLESLEKVMNDIEAEIGVSGYQEQFIIKATVHTTAKTAMGATIEDDFSHEITADIQAYILKLQGIFKHSDTGIKDSIGYSENGWFDYEVYLKPNKLYETNVLRSEGSAVVEPPSPSSTPQVLGPGLVYFPNIVDNITASFSYQFRSDKEVTNLVEEVEVTAVLKYPGMWSKSLTLVPKTSKSGQFVVDFPVDIKAFNAVTDTLRDELGFGAATYDLTIQATVHITGDIDSEHIDEVFAHSLQGQLGMTSFTLKGDLIKQQPGTIVKYRTVPVGKTWVFRALSLVGLALAVFGLLFVLRNSRQAQAVAISRMEEEALSAKRKHKGVIVDVGELPPIGAREAVIPIGSVDELVRTADALLKPVLHYAEADKHTYCIIDSGVRYLYVIETQK
jgi:hypothetical protein